jgi:uncharacterized protein (DUF111 family)
MKKNRPATLLSVIAEPASVDRLAQLLFAETTTLGLRVLRAERRVEARRIESIETAFGSVRIKVSASGSFAPEYEDCRALAIEKDVPIRTVLAEANNAYWSAHGGAKH